MVNMAVVLSGWLDLIILKIFSSLNDAMNLQDQWHFVQVSASDENLVILLTFTGKICFFCWVYNMYGTAFKINSILSIWKESFGFIPEAGWTELQHF